MKTQILLSYLNLTKRSTRNFFISLITLILCLSFGYSCFSQDTIYFDSSYYQLKIYHVYNLNNGSKGINPFSLQSDFLYHKSWIPDYTKGTLPLKFCYIPGENKYYIYGDRKILVMNEQNEITNETYISDYSSAFPLERLIFPDFKSVRMALNTNTNDEIYCTTNDGHFIIFNTTTDQEVFNTQIDLPYTHLTQSKIVYNKWNNHVYWIYYGIDATTSPLVFGTSVSGFLDFNATNREFVDTQSADNSHGYIDIFIHPARERYYLSVICTGSSKSEIRICNFSNICLNTYYVDLGYDNMYFIHHFDYLPPLDSGLNSWIYCLPDSRIPVTFTVDAILLDGDNDFADMEIQNLNGYSVTSGFYDQSLKRYYLGYDVMTGYINGVYVYDFSQDIFNPDLLLQDKRNAKPVNFCFNPEDHLVYCVFYDAIHSYDMDLDIELNDDYLYEPLLNAYYDDSRNEVVAINYTGGKIEKFDPITLNEDTDPLIIGSFVPKGVYCSGADKVLLYNQLNNYHSFLCLYDESTGSMNYYNTPNLDKPEPNRNF